MSQQYYIPDNLDRRSVLFRLMALFHSKADQAEWDHTEAELAIARANIIGRVNDIEADIRALALQIENVSSKLIEAP